jgi:hypothetical protein
MHDYRLLAAGFVIALCSCKTTDPPKEVPVATNQLPTATEVFDLRSKCAALGQKILDENLIGSALAQEQISHYSSESSRCYVKLDVHTADLTTPKENYLQNVYLFDGQTHELLASASAQGEQQWGSIFAVGLKGFAHDPLLPTHDEVNALIDNLMEQDRRP